MKTFLVVMILASSFSFAQQPTPLQFHGASLGQPASAYIDCTSYKLLNTRFHPMLGFKNKAAKTLKEICDGGSNHILIGATEIGGFMNPVEDTDMAFFNAGRIFEIGLFMHKQAFDNVVADMTVKLGRGPDNTDPQVLQNAMGAHWSFGQASWLADDMLIRVKESVNNTRIPPVADGVMVEITDPKNMPTEKRASSL